MDWKDHLRILEQAKEWDMAIEFMQDFIKENPNNVEAYIFMNYLLMNLLVEEHYDEAKHDYYETLTKTYFDESYAKFSDNAEYLFSTGITTVRSSIYRVTENLPKYGLRKGDQLYLDGLHKDHLEVFYKNGTFKTILNLDGTENMDKALKAVGRTL